MSFYWINILWLLLIPAALAVRELRRQRKVDGAITHPKIVRAEAGTKTLQLTGSAYRENRRKSHWRLLLGVSLAIVALARPQWGHLNEPVFDQAREIMIALDLSRSMLSTDVKPTRLERAKLLVSSLLERLSGERVGLIVFSGTAFLQSPLSSDYEILNEFLPEMTPDYLPEGGTNYEDLINTAVAGFGASSADRYLIILSDGEATDDHWKAAAEKLKSKGIRVIGLGVGTAEGSMIPDGTGGFMKDERGAVVLSKIEPETLKQLATLTHGVYSDASSWVDLAQLLKATVDAGQKGKFREERSVRLVERYQWALAPALLLLLWSFWQEFPVYPRPRDIKLQGAAAKIPSQKIPPLPPKTTRTIVTLLAIAFGLSGGSIKVKALAPSSENSAGAPLTQLVSQFSARDGLTAQEYAELAQATLTYGKRVQESKKPLLEGPIRDGLDAVGKGETLDPRAADWKTIKDQLEQLLEKPPTPTPPPQDQKNQDQPDKSKKDDASKQDQSKSDQSKQDQSKKDSESSDQSKSSQDNQDSSPKNSESSSANSNSPTPTPKSANENSGEKKPAQPADPNATMGDLQKPSGAPTPAPTPNPATAETQEVGGNREKREGEKQNDPALAVPLERLQQVKEGDSPLKIQQLLRGEKQAPDNHGKNW